MHKLLTLICTFSCMVLISDGCKSVKDQTAPSTQDEVGGEALRQIAEMRLGKPYEVEWNESRQFALVKKKMSVRTNDPYPTIRFFIFDNQKNEIIYENAEPGGKVLWESEQVVHVSSAIGIPNPDRKNSNPREYRYHVVNRKKFNGKFLKNQ